MVSAKLSLSAFQTPPFQIPSCNLVHLSTAVTQKRSAPPWVTFGSAWWVNIGSAPTELFQIAFSGGPGAFLARLCMGSAAKRARCGDQRCEHGPARYGRKECRLHE
jgi:hypothetical protein